MIRVDIVDSCPIFAHGLSAVLASEGIKVLGARQAPADALAWQADVFLVDPDAVGELGLAEFVSAARRTAPVLLVGQPVGPELLTRYMSTGAAGFVDRRSEIGALLAAVRAVADGGAVWTADAPAVRGAHPGNDDLVLSPRERQVLRQIARGLTHDQVARRLGISPHTVDTYVKRIRSKLHIGNKAELTRAALLGAFDTAPAR